MEEAQERVRKQREYLEEEARQRGIEDVESYVRAQMELSHGPFDPQNEP